MFVIKVKGYDRVLLQIATVENLNLRPAFQDAGKLLKDKFQNDNFKSEGSYLASDLFAGSWSPLKSSTIRDRIKKGFGGAHPILERTGDLRSAFYYKTTNVSKKNNYLEVSNKSKYFKYHQVGTKKMVARPMLALPEFLINKVKDIFLTEMNKQLFKK